MAAQVDALIFPGPIACEASRFAVACLLIAVEFAAVVHLAGFVAPVAFEALVVVDLAAAVEASADCLGTDPEQHLPTLHTDRLVGRKLLRRKQQGETPVNTAS